MTHADQDKQRGPPPEPDKKRSPTRDRKPGEERKSGAAEHPAPLRL